MKHIGVFVKNLTSGGAEKQSVLLAKALAGECEMHYIVFNGGKVHEKYLELLHEDKRISVHILNGSRLKRFKELVKCLRDNKISALFSYLTAANFYACMAGRIVGVDVYTGLRNAELPFLKRIADCFMTNQFAKLAVSNSYSGKSNFERYGFNGGKIVVIPNCYEKISPYVAKKSRDYLTIITVGRFVRQKDYATAIKSVAELKKRGVPVHYCIVGYGELEKSIRSWVEEYGVEDVTDILINPDGIPDLLKNADIYLSTSLFEGTSNSIMEAMDANLPIVATKVGDNDRLVQVNENGYLYDVGDYKGISEGLLKLVEENEVRELYGKRSKSILEENYSVATFREKYIKLLNNGKV